MARHMHASKRPLGALLTPPRDASGHPPRLPGCVRLAAASQAAIGGRPRPQPPLMLLLLLLGCCSGRPPETPERARARPPSPIRAAKPPPPPPPTLRPWSQLLLPPFQPPSQPQRPLKPPHDACAQGTRKGQKRCTNGRRVGQKGGNGRRRVARAGVVVLAAAGPGKAACRHASAAAGRVRGRTYLHAKCMVEAQKSYEGQTDDPEAAGRARDGRSRPAGQWNGLGEPRSTRRAAICAHTVRFSAIHSPWLHTPRVHVPQPGPDAPRT